MLNRALGLAPLLGAVAGIAAALLVAAASARYLGEVALRTPPPHRAQIARGWMPTLQVALVVLAGYGALAGAVVRTLRRRDPGEPVIRSKRLWLRVLPAVTFIVAIALVTLSLACLDIANGGRVRWGALGRGPFLTIPLVLTGLRASPLVMAAAIAALPAYAAFVRNVERLPAAAVWILGAIAVALLAFVPGLALLGLPALVAD